ncbi:MAG: carboxypeptidase-like regulatory domain-containing protein, partial [Pseudohongiella sp.]
MHFKRTALFLAVTSSVLALAACGPDAPQDTPVTTSSVSAEPATSPSTTVSIDADDVGGVVTGPDGAEAGVWVIAETMELPTRYAKIVVTDDEGRYLIPDLPDANYDVWVRGYGLVDSPKVSAVPGVQLDLEAVVAPDAAAAAEYYPAGYWYSLLEVPGQSEFPGTGPDGNGISPGVSNQADYIRRLTNGGCVVCHQMGNKATRELLPMFQEFDTTVEAWHRRVQSGQAGGSMLGTITAMGAERTLAMYADWTDRIEAGELPPVPLRPQGAERNVVITQWDWADPTAYLHDLVSTDRRDPTVNAYGKIYGALENSADYLPVLDPQTHSIDEVPVFPLPESGYDPEPAAVAAPSPYWDDESIWDSATTVHNPMMDAEGRVWITART